MNIWAGNIPVYGEVYILVESEKKVPNTNDFLWFRKYQFSTKPNSNLQINSERLISYVGKLKPFMKTN